MRSPQFSSRVRVLLILMLSALAVVWGRLFYLQTFDHGDYRKQADLQSTEKIIIPAERGKIFDRKGEILALSMPAHSVVVNPALTKKDPAAAASALAAILAVDQEQLHRALLDPPGEHFVWVKRLVTPDQEAAVRALRLKGVQLVEEQRRFYPNGAFAAHLLGFTGIDQNGLAGVEFAFDARLRGTDGFRMEGRDGLARSISGPECTYVPPVNGQSLVLTIDTNVQDFLETAMQRCFQQYAPLSVTGIVMDPRTGDVLALADLPGFDPNRYRESPRENWRLRAVTDTFEPGSVFKPFVFSSALTNDLIRLDELIFCGNGAYQVGARTLHDHHPYANLTAMDVVAKSSNVGMAKIGQRIGAARMCATLQAFGFGRPTGVGLTAEAPGSLTPPNKWSDYTITSVPMGHEVAVTALQIAVAFSAFANGGYLLKPRVVRGFISPEGRVLERHADPQVVAQVLDGRTAHTMMTQVLRKVVSEGTGRLADLKDYEIGGKTGTAQKFVDGAFSHDRYVSSFVCAGPVDDPRLVVLIVVNEPSKGASLYGGTVAAPQCADVMKATLDYMYIDSRRRSAQVRLALADAQSASAKGERRARNAP